MGTKQILILIFFSLIFLPSLVSAKCTDNEACLDATRWYDFSRFDFTYFSMAGEVLQKMEFTKTINGDGLAVESIVTKESKTNILRLFSINHGADLYSGVGKTGIYTMQQCEETVRDTATILGAHAMKVMFLLSRGTGLKPEEIGLEVKVDFQHKDGDTRLQINPGDSLTIGSPWSIKGMVQKVSDDITFDLKHEYINKGKPAKVSVSGMWSNKPAEIKIPDNEPLDNWLVCLPPPQMPSKKLKTVKDLRELVGKAIKSSNPSADNQVSNKP